MDVNFPIKHYILIFSEYVKVETRNKSAIAICHISLCVGHLLISHFPEHLYHILICK